MKVGYSMKSVFNPDSTIMVFLSKVADVMILSVMWAITSIPLFTTGASTTALYYVMFKLVDNENVAIVSTYFRAFCREFKQSTCAFMLMLLYAGILVAEYVFIVMGMDEDASWLKVLLGVVAVLMAMGSSYIFPYIAKFQHSLKMVFVNSFYFARKNIIISALITLINSIPVWILYFYTPTFVRLTELWILIGYGLIGAINAKLIYVVFKKYIPENDAQMETN